MVKISQLNKLIVIALITFILSACGGGGGGSSSTGAIADPSDDSITVGGVGSLTYSPDSCSEDDQKAFIYKAMHDVYYWSSQTPDLDYTAYASQDALLDALKYDTYDKWSYVIPKTTYNAYYAGDNVGLGITMGISAGTDEIFLTHVYPGSPADLAGFQRGYSLTAVNGYTAAQMISDANIYDTAFGPSEEGYSVDIDYIDNSSSAGSATVVKDEYYADSVAAYDIFTNAANGKKIGYLSYLAFSGNYYTDMFPALSAFETNGVEELVVDLRYNGGGLLSAAIFLSSQIGGSGLTSGLMYTYLHNTFYSAWNRSSYFSSPTYDLDISKVVFLVTPSSASASETVINNLLPYMDVTLIGSTTHGKPVGMYAFPYCDNYIVPISFKTVNADNEGDYFGGMSVDCAASDDVTHQLGDEAEGMLSEAILYLETGTCTNPRAEQGQGLESVRGKGINYVFNMR
jgi:C-terminal processing protease CtpA/Prc